MRQPRTDLAIERRAMRPGATEGVEVTQEEKENCRVVCIRVVSDAGAAALGKPKGTYYTVETDGFPAADALTDGRLTAVRQALEALLPPAGAVLVVGLGNPAITPDALGPKCAGMVFATRHIPAETRRALALPPLREVCAIAPGVTGQTGFEATEVAESLCRRLKPAAVIAVDALAAGSAERLARTVQLSSAGIEPGAGVGNARQALNQTALGVPVIAVGVPTVVDALSLSRDVTGARPKEEAAWAELMVTPRDVDALTDNAARLLALAINLALQKELDAETLLGLM